MLAGRTGFHAHDARLKPFEERQHLSAPERSVEGDRSPVSDAVDLKDFLGQIKTVSGNMHGVAPLSQMTTPALWRIATPGGAGAIHPIC